MKVKHKRETLDVLVIDEGEILESSGAILKETHDFYQQLFSAEEETKDIKRERDSCLELISNKVSEAQNRMLVIQSEEKEIDKIVDNLAADKSPGIDKITAEAIWECWSFLKQDCLDVVLAIWRDGQLTDKMKKGLSN